MVLRHGRCTTGICQVSDTGLHDLLEKVYMELEGVSFMEQQMVDLGNISRSQQQALALDYSSVIIFLDQAASAWHVQYSTVHESLHLPHKCLRPCTYSTVLYT